MSRVLVVDDQPDIRALLRSILELHGHEVVSAPGGREALDQLADAEVALVLLDVQMPELDGWETLSLIRSRYGEFGPNVAMCTVKSHPRDLIQGWELGCDGYIEKPFDIRQLLSEVETISHRSSDARANARRTALGEANHMLRSRTAS